MKEVDLEYVTLQTKRHIISIGDFVRKKRILLGYSQQTIACMMLTDKCLISEIERGRYKNITLSTLIKLAFVLDVDIKEFF